MGNGRLRLASIMTLWFLLTWGYGYGGVQPLAYEASPEAVRIQLLLKLLAVHNISEPPVSDTLLIAVLFDPATEVSQQRALDCAEILRTFLHRDFQGKYFQYVQKSGWEYLYSAQQNPDALLLVDLSKPLFVETMKWAETRKIVTMGLHREDVKQGTAMAVDIAENDRPEIYLNMESLKKLGIEFSADVLQLSKLYR